MMYSYDNRCCIDRFIGTACAVCEAGSMQLSVRLSLSHPAAAAAAGLLLWARRPGYIDRLLHGRRSAANAAASSTLSADVVT